jgi:hypothetical protein
LFLLGNAIGWIQELDGEPAEVSAWYRGKDTMQDKREVSNFEALGLKMYVYTNAYNC